MYISTNQCNLINIGINSNFEVPPWTISATDVAFWRERARKQLFLGGREEMLLMLLQMLVKLSPVMTVKTNDVY